MSYVKPTFRELPADLEQASCCGPTLFFGKITFGGNCRPVTPPSTCTDEVCVVVACPSPTACTN